MKNKIYFFIVALTFIAEAGKSQVAAKDTGLKVAIVNFAWMPDGKSLLLTAGQFKMTNKRLQPLVLKILSFNLLNRRVDTVLTNAVGPEVSPDGKKIAFSRRLKAPVSVIYIYDIKTKSFTAVTPDSLRSGSPSWSPDGKRLVTDVTRNKITELYVIDPATHTFTQLSHSAPYNSYSPAWSPVNNEIVYFLEKGDNHDQIYLTDINGSFHHNLTNDTATHNYYPSWMGKDKIIYTLSPSSLVSMNKDGSGKKVIDSIATFFVRYNAAANTIAFLTKPPNSKLMFYNVKTGQITEVLDAVELDKYF